MDQSLRLFLASLLVVSFTLQICLCAEDTKRKGDGNDTKGDGNDTKGDGMEKNADATDTKDDGKDTKPNITAKAASWKRKQVTAWKWQGGRKCQGGGTGCQPQIGGCQGSGCRPQIGGCQGSGCRPQIGGCQGSGCRPQIGGCQGSGCRPQIGGCQGSGCRPQIGGCQGGQCGGGGIYPQGCQGGQCGGGGGGIYPQGCQGGHCGGGGGGIYPQGCQGGQCGGGGTYPVGCQGGQCGGGGTYPQGCQGGQCGGGGGYIGGGGCSGGQSGCIPNYGVGYTGNPGQNYNQWGNQQSCYNNLQQGNCNFYNCYNQQYQCPSSQNYCLGYGQPYCQRNNQWYNSYNQAGQGYINNVRRCQMGALTPGGGTCSQINQQGYGALIGLGGQNSCYWQNGQFCNVINSPQNCQALYNNYQGTGYTDYCIYRSMNNLASQCGGSQNQNFQQYYGTPFMQNLQQSGVNYGAYNQHYNQNYGQSSWKK